MFHRQKRREACAAWIFLAPGLIGLFLFVFVPILASLLLSFTNWSLLGSLQWVGFANYWRLFTLDPSFYTILGNTIFFTLEYLVLNIILSLALALWISNLKRGQRWFRVVFFIPTFAPAVAASVVWLLIFTPGGFMDYVTSSLALAVPNLLLDADLAMQVIIIVALWANLGYNVVLFNAALDLVPQIYLDAARIDGASSWRRLWNIRLPLISPTVFFGTVMTAITSLQVFDQIYVLTSGGPGSSTATLGFAIYQHGFQNYRMGYASSLAWVMFVIILILTILQFRLQKKWVHYDS